MSIPAKDVPCPCCGKTLYVTEAPHEAGLIYRHKGLDLDQDENGSFMRCPHCSKRVVFVSTPSLVGAGLRLGDTQPCADCQ